jgi:hypothetical protein
MEAGAVIQFLKIDYQRIFQLTLILIGLVISISNIFEWRLFKSLNCISGIMVSVLVSSTVDRGFEPRSGQTKDYKNGICCFSAKHSAIRRKNKDWLAQNQNNMSEWSDMSTRRLLFK